LIPSSSSSSMALVQTRATWRTFPDNHLDENATRRTTWRQEASRRAGLSLRGKHANDMISEEPGGVTSLVIESYANTRRPRAPFGASTRVAGSVLCADVESGYDNGADARQVSPSDGDLGNVRRSLSNEGNLDLRRVEQTGVLRAMRSHRRAANRMPRLEETQFRLD